MSGTKPEALNVPVMPEEMEYLWHYYLQLKNAGDVNYQTIKAFSELMAVELKPREVSLIMDFENEYRRAQNGS